MICSTGDDRGATNGGCVNIYFGGPTIKDEPDITLIGQNANSAFSSSASFAGDVNGDGYPDIIIGGIGMGKASLYLGSSSMDDIPDLIFTALDSDRHFGNSVSTARTSIMTGMMILLSVNPEIPKMEPIPGKPMFFSEALQ
jgi:hypothetical protein